MFADQVFERQMTFPEQYPSVGSCKEARESGYGWVGLFGLTLLILLAIEAVLAFRVWTQLSGDAPAGGLQKLVYSLGGSLTSPFGGYETFDSGKSAGILQYSALIAAEAYLVAGIVVLVIVYLFRGWTSALWSFVSRPLGAGLGWLGVGAGWLATSASFGLRRLIDEATVFYLNSVHPVAKRHFSAGREYLEREGPVYLRAAGTEMRRGAEYVKREGPVYLRTAGTEIRRGAEIGGRGLARTSATAGQASRVAAARGRVVGARWMRLSGQWLARASMSLLAFAEREMSQLNLELRRLARDYANARARHYHG